MRAAIFDLGGTLLRWSIGPEEVRDASVDLGTPLSPEEATQLWGELNERPATSEELSMGAGWSESAYARALWSYYRAAEATVPGLAGWLVARAVDPATYLAFPGAAELVKDLAAAGVHLSVLSDTGFDVRPALTANDLTALGDVVLLSHEQGACKPAPWLFTRACDLMGATASESLMVGDNPAADGGSVVAGVAALILPVLGSERDRNYAVVRAAFGLDG